METILTIMEALKYFECSPSGLKISVDPVTHQCFWESIETGQRVKACVFKVKAQDQGIKGVRPH